jgi:hypothetical protein
MHIVPWVNYLKQISLDLGTSVVHPSDFSIIILLQSNVLTLLLCIFIFQGNFEAFTRQCGCCRGLAEDEERREHLEVACDLATHYFCHPCALCQEGRELRRRVPHPGFNGRSVFVMMPPTEQTMGRAMWTLQLQPCHSCSSVPWCSATSDLWVSSFVNTE